MMNAPDFTPGKLLEISGGYWKTCVLHAGVKLDIFSTLGADSMAGEEIAQKIATDARATLKLLDALTAVGLLEKKDDTYANTEASLKFLSKTSPQYIGYIILHHHHLMESWAKLDQGIRSGKPVRSRSAHADDGRRREAFLMGMFNMAMSMAPQVVKSIDLSDRSRLLDLGGGPGTYAVHFCLNNPQLRATVYDLASSRPFAEKTIVKFGLTDRVRFVGGNYLQDPVEGTYDAVWLSHILHAEGPQNCQTIIAKAAAALKPGGMIIIHDFILDDSMAAPLFPALFSLNMLLGTEGGQSYSETRLREMLTKAGVRQIKRLAFEGPTQSGILTGRI